MKKNLTAETLELLDKFVEALESNWAEEVDFYFEQGVKMGVNLGMECAEDKFT